MKELNNFCKNIIFILENLSNMYEYLILNSITKINYILINSRFINFKLYIRLYLRSN